MVPTRLTCDVDYCLVHTDSGPGPLLQDMRSITFSLQRNPTNYVSFNHINHHIYNYKEKESDRLPKLHYSFEFICPVVTRDKI